MTDDLIARLHVCAKYDPDQREAIEALQEKDRHIAELEAEIGKHIMRVFALMDLLPDATLCGELQEATARRHEMPARIAALEAALKPFAEHAKVLDDPLHDPDETIVTGFNDMYLTAGDLRAARAALGENKL